MRGVTARTSPRRDQKGAAAVEFALIMPVFIMLIFGLVTTAFVYNDKLSVANAVREGARFGASTLASTGSPPAGNAVWADDVRKRVQQVYFNAGSTLSNSQICVALVSGTGATPVSYVGPIPNPCALPPASPIGLAADSCVVKVWVAKPAKIQLIVAPDMNLTLRAESVAAYGRPVTGGTWPCRT